MTTPLAWLETEATRVVDVCLEAIRSPVESDRVPRIGMVLSLACGCSSAVLSVCCERLLETMPGPKPLLGDIATALQVQDTTRVLSLFGDLHTCLVTH